MIYYLVHEDKDKFLQEYQKILLRYPSSYDLISENSYHALMLGMCICLRRDYTVISNREEGMGRGDLILKPHKETDTSFVFELKYTKEEDLEELSHKAVQQIKEKKYDVDLKGKVIYIGLAHKGKEAKMEWIERE